jgi:uncharacterized protein (DUF1697 family)
MPVYVAMIRGINVGGHKIVRMADLRKSCAALGFTEVETYIQSGNVIFKTGKGTAELLSKKIEEKILVDFGFEVSVISRTGEELQKVLAKNPFVKRPGIDLSRLHVTFLSAEPASAAIQSLNDFSILPEEFRCAGRELYLHLPVGLGKSKWAQIPVERLLSVRATTRNWNTVNKLSEMATACC